ncbi:MAG TPA: hypothetical protein VK145_01990 [Candidatus Nanoarchaeia archaeon]|nr:hypothetical protein [Candidatus Nanoarchaeia archaeon]
METTNQRSVGPTIGLIVIILMITLGSIYFWTNRTVPANNVPENNTESSDEMNRIKNQSSSDETTAIGTDLEAFSESDIDNIDNGL